MNFMSNDFIDVIEEASDKVERTYAEWQAAIGELNDAKARQRSCNHNFVAAVGACSKCGMTEYQFLSSIPRKM